MLMTAKPDKATRKAAAQWGFTGLQKFLKNRPTSMPFTTEDVRKAVGHFPMPACGWGGIMHKARKAGLVRNTGSLRRSHNKSRRGGMSVVWEKIPQTLPKGIDTP